MNESGNKQATTELMWNFLCRLYSIELSIPRYSLIYSVWLKVSDQVKFGGSIVRIHVVNYVS